MQVCRTWKFSKVQSRPWFSKSKVQIKRPNICSVGRFNFKRQPEVPHNTQKNELQKKFANAKSKQINFYLLFMSLRAFKWSKFFHNQNYFAFWDGDKQSFYVLGLNRIRDWCNFFSLFYTGLSKGEVFHLCLYSIDLHKLQAFKLK